MRYRMGDLEFEWDPEKNRRNIAKHGIRFQDACKVFDDYTLRNIDNRYDYGEERLISTGLLNGVVIIVVVHTDRNGICRIISARRAKRKERIDYETALQQTTNNGGVS